MVKPDRMKGWNVVVIETGGPRAGCALWKREDMDRYPFLRIDYKSEKQRT